MPELSATVDKACAVLDSLMLDAPRATLVEVAQRIGSSRTATLRILNTLLAHGLVQLDDRRYSLGPKIAGLAHSRARHNPVVLQLHPIVRDLVNRTGCHGYYGYLRDSDAVVLGMEAGSDALAVIAEPGEVYPAHTVAFGLAAAIGSPPYGWSGHTLPADLERSQPALASIPAETVEEVWRRGVAICRELTHPGMYSYGLALPTGDRVAGISLSFTVLGKTPEQIAAKEAEVIDVLLELKRTWHTGRGGAMDGTDGRYRREASKA